MNILEYILDFLVDPFGGWKNLNNNGEFTEVINYKKKYIKIKKILVDKVNDYVILKEKSNKLLSQYKVLDNILKEKDFQYKKVVNMVEQHKKLIVEKDIKIDEITKLCNEYEKTLDINTHNIQRYEEVLDEYKKQLMLNYTEQQKIIAVLQEQKNQITLLTRKNKELTNKVAFLTVLLEKKKD